MGALNPDIIVSTFWGAMLIPYLLIGVWGSGSARWRREVLPHTLVGSLLMLVAILAIYFVAHPPKRLRLRHHLQRAAPPIGWIAGRRVRQPPAGGGVPEGVRAAAVLARAGLAIKGPAPVHTRLPDAHVQAPVAGSIILAGDAEDGDLWRYAVPLFPSVAYARPLMASLAVAGIVYGAGCARRSGREEADAYSSVSQSLLHARIESAAGSAYHARHASPLGRFVRHAQERRYRLIMTRGIGDAEFAAVFPVVTFVHRGAGTNGCGGFLVLLAPSSSLSTWYGALAATGVILGAAYMLWMVQRVFFGPLVHRENAHLRDLGPRELVTALPLVAAALWMGLYPQPFLERLRGPTERFVARVNLGVPGVEQDDEAVRLSVMPLPPLEETTKPAQPQVSENP